MSHDYDKAPLERELAPEKSWRTAYPYVEAQARLVLDVLEPSVRLSTTALVDRIYSGVATDPKVRNRIFKGLRAASERGLARYVSRGEPETIGHVENARRLQWHRGLTEMVPPAKSCCQACGRPL